MKVTMEVHAQLTKARHLMSLSFDEPVRVNSDSFQNVYPRHRFICHCLDDAYAPGLYSNDPLEARKGLRYIIKYGMGAGFPVFSEWVVNNCPDSYATCDADVMALARIAWLDKLIYLIEQHSARQIFCDGCWMDSAGNFRSPNGDHRCYTVD
jgi:hypothetical protein